MWAARPHLGSIFEKLLHRKTFICLRLEFCNLFSMHKKTSLLWEAFLL